MSKKTFTKYLLVMADYLYERDVLKTISEEVEEEILDEMDYLWSKLSNLEREKVKAVTAHWARNHRSAET
jgi:hypothetical protein